MEVAVVLSKGDKQRNSLLFLSTDDVFSERSLRTFTTKEHNESSGSKSYILQCFRCKIRIKLRERERASKQVKAITLVNTNWLK